MTVDVASLPSVDDVSPPPRIAVSFVRPLAVGISKLGIVPAEFLSTLGLPPDAREGYIPIGDLARAVDSVAVKLAMPHLGIELARMLPLGSLGASDYCFSTSATLIDGLRRIASHIGMFTETTKFELHIDGDLARISQSHLFKPLGVLTELATAFAVRRLRDVLGEGMMKIVDVRFIHPERAPSPAYEEFFGVAPRFGQVADDFAFPRELLMAPLLTADGTLATMLAEYRPPSRAGAGAVAEDSFVTRVRAAIEAMLAVEEGVIGVDELASRLKLSPRTLQRRLGEHGSSCSKLIDDARRTLAETLLARDGVLLANVAYRLGFQDMTAFFRAFRRWTGSSPRAFQKTLRERQNLRET